MAPHRRLFVLLTLAVLLPLLIFLSLQIGFSYRAERDAVQLAALERVRRMVRESDAELERTRTSLRILATIPSLADRNWPAAYARADEIARFNTDWRAVRLIDAGDRQLVFDSRRPFGAPRSLAQDTIPSVPAGSDVVFEGISQHDSSCLCIGVLSPFKSHGRLYLWEVLLDPAPFQKVALGLTPRDTMSGIVDRDGRFIARTIAYRARLGTQATHFVRDAIETGHHSGVYSGTTYEGFRNYSAFATSPLTGWSAHLAISSSLIDSPQRRGRVATITAALVSLALAVGLVWLGLRSLRTERRSEERLRQAERIEAVGKLTAGVAHDFNNMLAVITSSLELAQRRLARGQTDVDRFLTTAAEGARRAADLTHRMLAFSRQQPLEPAPLDVNQLIDSMGELLGRTLGEHIEVNLRLAPGIWVVHADRPQLENAILNLAINARDAMDEGGKLTVSTANVRAERTRRGGDRTSADEQVRISVADTGTGMTPGVVNRAFEPFFSTKDVGKGTGLGLSQILGFVRQSGGDVRIASAPDHGTTVSLYLPRHTGAALPAPSYEAAADALPKGRPEETILVVEDEDRVRLSASESLRELGYSVRDAENGTAALDMLNAHADVCLLFTDLTMPGMSGLDLAEQATRARPDLPVLLTTAHHSDERLSRTSWQVLHKPYDFGKLAWAVRRAIGDQPG